MDQTPIFYINLAARTDRRAFMIEQLQRLGLQASRIEAVTSQSVPAEWRSRYGDPRRYGWLTPAEMACTLSHMKAAEAVLRSGAPWACILEDDAQLSPSLPRFLAALPAKPPTLDVLRIEVGYRPNPMKVSPELKIGDYRVFRHYGWLKGTAGYILSAHGARVISGGEGMLGYTADDALFNPYRPLSRRLTIRCLSPALCTEAESYLNGESATSDIYSERATRASAEAAHTWHNILRKAQLVIDQDIWQGGRKSWHLMRGVEKRDLPFKAD
ncbi:MAG: glycosyltransferase family 25 protein [Devosia sp.]|nr:glycosyltransferase family 25 protein [Devosia sp.]